MSRRIWRGHVISATYTECGYHMKKTSPAPHPCDVFLFSIILYHQRSIYLYLRALIWIHHIVITQSSFYSPFYLEIMLNIIAMLMTGWKTVALGALIACVLWYWISYHMSPLRRYPGPTLAGKQIMRLLSANIAQWFCQWRISSLTFIGWTNLWRVIQVVSGDYAPRIKKLHEKYGPIVRLGPNLIDLDLPELSSEVYGTDGRWNKVCTISAP